MNGTSTLDRAIFQELKDLYGKHYEICGSMKIIFSAGLIAFDCLSSEDQMKLIRTLRKLETTRGPKSKTAQEVNAEDSMRTLKDAINQMSPGVKIPDKNIARIISTIREELGNVTPKNSKDKKLG